MTQRACHRHSSTCGYVNLLRMLHQVHLYFAWSLSALFVNLLQIALLFVAHHALFLCDSWNAGGHVELWFYTSLAFCLNLNARFQFHCANANLWKLLPVRQCQVCTHTPTHNHFLNREHTHYPLKEEIYSQDHYLHCEGDCTSHCEAGKHYLRCRVLWRVPCTTKGCPFLIFRVFLYTLCIYKVDPCSVLFSPLLRPSQRDPCL